MSLKDTRETSRVISTGWGSIASLPITNQSLGNPVWNPTSGIYLPTSCNLQYTWRYTWRFDSWKLRHLFFLFMSKVWCVQLYRTFFALENGISAYCLLWNSISVSFKGEHKCVRCWEEPKTEKLVYLEFDRVMIWVN